MKETSEKIAEEKMSVDTGNTGDIVEGGWRRDIIGRYGGWDKKKGWRIERYGIRNI